MLLFNKEYFDSLAYMLQYHPIKRSEMLPIHILVMKSEHKDIHSCFLQIFDKFCFFN